MEETSETRYAGFWIRFLALLVDNLILLPAGMVLGFAVGMAFVGYGIENPAVYEYGGNAVGFIGTWLYYTLMTSSAPQGTLGKMAVGIKVTDEDGERIGLGRANARYWSKILSFIILLIGYVMVAFTRRKQGLHDMIADTLVVKKA